MPKSKSASKRMGKAHSQQRVVRDMRPMDKLQLLSAHLYGWATPRSGNNGKMLNSQWRSWLKLQRLGLAEIEGSGEAEDLILTETGKRVAACL